MRDDLSAKFDSIIFCQNKKINLLTDFRNKEFELKHLLHGKVEDSIIEIINSENEIIEKIDLCDYDISSYIDEVKNKTGIDPYDISIKKYFKKEIQLNTFMDNKIKIDAILCEINMIRTENLKSMEQIADETSRSGDELNRIDKVKNLFSKDLRSSWF